MDLHAALPREHLQRSQSSVVFVVSDGGLNSEHLCDFDPPLSCTVCLREAVRGNTVKTATITISLNLLHSALLDPFRRQGT